MVVMITSTGVYLIVAAVLLVIIGGGIAAYRSLELIRALKKRGLAVRCILTAAHRWQHPYHPGERRKRLHAVHPARHRLHHEGRDRAHRIVEVGPRVPDVVQVDSVQVVPIRQISLPSVSTVSENCTNTESFS